MEQHFVGVDLSHPNLYAEGGLLELSEYLEKWALFDLYLHEHEAEEASDELADRQSSGKGTVV